MGVDPLTEKRYSGPVPHGLSLDVSFQTMFLWTVSAAKAGEKLLV